MKIFSIITSILILLNTLSAENYPDQPYILRIDDIIARAESTYNLRLSPDGKCIEMQDGATQGYMILKPDTSDHPFNRGLPSWNGTVRDDNTSFLIQMRFPEGSGWSDWLTVGYWKNFIWGSYGRTSFSGGYVDIDYVKLNSYANRWQFRINMLRKNASESSPTVHKLSFFVSDTRTTESIDYNSILNDNPAEIFIPTEFFYQYAIDDEIGGSICSPTSVSMALRSYDIEVDPYYFAVDTYDPYHKIFGVWPRAVQNASEKGLEGTVNRYRTWSEAREVLAKGGRIVITVGRPLYAGHLMMLAGFTSDGKPIVHDPARSNGYAYVFNKSDLSRSWFDKGGIAYTFFPADSQATSIHQDLLAGYQPQDFQLFQNYPNPFNSTTQISFNLKENTPVELTIHNATGGLVKVLYNQHTPAGFHQLTWNAADLASGAYFIRLSTGRFQKVIKTVLIK